MDHDRYTLRQTNHGWYAPGVESLQISKRVMHAQTSLQRFSSRFEGGTYACVAIVVALTDNRQSQILLLFMTQICTMYCSVTQ